MGSPEALVWPARMAPPRLRRAIVPRERLLSRLRSLADPAVCVVHGPPGYGKSTLVAQLADADARDVRWLTLVEDDADPVRLVADLALALGDGKADGSVPSLARLIDNIGRHRQDSLIVLDDIHRVAG